MFRFYQLKLTKKILILKNQSTVYKYMKKNAFEAKHFKILFLKIKPR